MTTLRSPLAMAHGACVSTLVTRPSNESGRVDPSTCLTFPTDQSDLKVAMTRCEASLPAIPSPQLCLHGIKLMLQDLEAFGEGHVRRPHYWDGLAVTKRALIGNESVQGRAVLHCDPA